MRRRFVIFVLAASAASAASLAAQDIHGTILITRRLTHRSVTAPVPIYQRGPTVQLAHSTDDDPLAFERSHVVIYLEGPASPASASKNPYVLQQQDRQFLPDLLVVPAGAAVSFPNHDPIFHNVFSLSGPKSFDLGSYDQGDSRTVTFPKPGIVFVYCHLHTNMTATILVAPNRFYAQSGRDGHFDIRGVPPGRYTVVAWHKAVGSFRQPLTIEPGKDATITFNLPLADIIEDHPHAAHSALNHGGQ